MEKRKQKTFRATLVLVGGALNWTGVRLPFDVANLWKKRGQIRVCGTINGFAFRTTLFPTGDGGHFLLVNKTMQKGARARRGDTAEFQLGPDTAERELVLPKELATELQRSKRMQKFFSTFSPSRQRWFADEVAKKKDAATRKRRAEQVAELLLETMDAERALPPLIEQALAANPKARAGWKKMTPIQRRQQLMGVFYYRTPASRARRLQKAIEAMTGKIKE